MTATPRFFESTSIMELSPATPYGEANVATPAGDWLVATCDHPASSYGQPVVVDADGVAYGPTEIGPLREGGCLDLLPALRAAGYEITSIQDEIQD